MKGLKFIDQKGKLFGRDDGRFGGKVKKSKEDNFVTIGGSSFEIQKIKGKKVLVLPFEKFLDALAEESDDNKLAQIGGLRGKVILNHHELLSNEKVELISKVVKNLNLKPLAENEFSRKININITEEGGTESLIKMLDFVLRVAVAKSKTKELGFLSLFTNGHGVYWFKISRGFPTALNESLSSLETLIDETAVALSPEQKEKVNSIYRKLNSLYE